MEQKTNKKVKVIGTQYYINTNTGEIEPMQVTSIEDRDFNFTKVWMKNFISTLDLIGNKKSKVAFWIIDNLNKENQITMTQRQISEATGISYPVVNETMKCLIDANFLKQQNWGVYMINPDIVFKGTRNGRLNVLNTYGSIEKEKKEISKEEQLSNLLTSITQLQIQATKLQEEIQKEKNSNNYNSDEQKLKMA